MEPGIPPTGGATCCLCRRLGLGADGPAKWRGDLRCLSRSSQNLADGAGNPAPPWSQRRDSNPRPLLYKSTALPLSYAGQGGAGLYHCLPRGPVKQVFTGSYPGKVLKELRGSRQLLWHFTERDKTVALPLSYIGPDGGIPPIINFSGAGQNCCSSPRHDPRRGWKKTSPFTGRIIPVNTAFGNRRTGTWSRRPESNPPRLSSRDL